MGKRKQSAPQKVDEEKRKWYSWNMFDNANKEDPFSTIADNETTLCEKIIAAECEREQDLGTTISLVGKEAQSPAISSASIQSPCFRRDDLIDIFNLYTESCSIHIPLLSQSKLKPETWSCVLASFSLKFLPGPLYVPLPSECLPAVDSFTLYIRNEGNKHIFSYQTFEHSERFRKTPRKRKATELKDAGFWLVETDLTLKCLEALKCKLLLAIIDTFDPLGLTVQINIVGTDSILTKLDYPSRPASQKMLNQSLCTLFAHFYSMACPDYSSLPYTKKHDIDKLFSVIKQRHSQEAGVILHNIQHPDLLPRLRLYQQQAISWMVDLESNNAKGVMSSMSDEPHMLYTKIVTLDSKLLYYNRYAGVLVKDFPRHVTRAPGGILADEMGLGKTVEVLACMLHNPRGNLAHPEVLPIIEDLEEEQDKKKRRKKKKKDKVTPASNPSDSDDTINYAENGLELRNDGSIGLQIIQDSNSVVKEQDDDFVVLDEDGNNAKLEDHRNDVALGENGNIIREHQGTERTYKNIFTEKPAVYREDFECLCGALSKTRQKKKHPVQCTICRLWQHAECVNYDLKDPYRGEFKCPHCHVASPPIPSGATLIISPFAIAHQWVEEILKHVVKEAINVFMYMGVSKQGFIQPHTLARQDIVITTYETLRKEIDYVDLPHSNSSVGRQLRHPKRFMAVPSPITAVEWWRICLDEAQMLECTTTKTAEMALRLSAVNKWCVTGTPIQKGIDDLYGLLLFLNVDPYCVRMWWNKLAFEPFCYGIKEPMYDLLSSVMWRTAKMDVANQINIPSQSDQLNWLTFSPVEEHFYRRQYRECVRLSVERLSKWTDSSTKLSSLDRQTVSQLLYPLLRLRQACCHPQAVRGEFLPIQKTTMTMDELLESLTKKVKLEAEESHRALVAAMNGQAGLHVIDEEFVEAADKYREVLRSVEEYKGHLHTDSLQQLHAMYNLHELLSGHRENIAPTLRDDQLSMQIGELKDKYLSKATSYAKATEEALAAAQIDVKQLQREFPNGCEWWLDVIEWACTCSQEELLVLKVRDDLLDNRNPGINTLVRSCRSATGLEYAIHTQLTALQTAYKDVLNAMKELGRKPSRELLHTTVECCLRPAADVLKICPFCKTEELFEMYEAKLFSFVEKGIESHMDHLGYRVNVRRQGTWADSEVERALKSILSYARTYRVSDELIEFGSTHIKLLDAQKKEYKKLHSHWTALKEHVASLDELDMCTTRLRLRLPDEPVPVTPQNNILDKVELPTHKFKLVSDRIVAQGELQKKHGQLLYLTNLAKNQANTEDGRNPEPCPICQQELGREWSVMQCGHCYCIECIRTLGEQARFGRRNFSVRCAVCRQNTHQGEISYVTTTQSHKQEDGGYIRVNGSHSTKVEAVVRCLLRIKTEDPAAKALVFSTWTDVLSVIAKALDENNISYKALYMSQKFQENLTAFRLHEDVSALLLPVHSGANGLNLIEATHVILVEPILNPARELQALGRVHRIGQTKATHVHRFLIRGTIEQKMHVLLQSMGKHSLLQNSEEMSLTIGDLSSLFSQQIDDEDAAEVRGHNDSEGLSPEITVTEPGQHGVGHRLGTGCNELHQGLNGSSESEFRSGLEMPDSK